MSVKKNLILFTLLLFIPFGPFQAEEYQSSKTFKGIASGIQIASGLAKQFIQAKKDQQLLELQLQNNMNLMNQLGPKVAPINPASPFPNCPRPAANPPFPAGACSNINDENSMIQASMIVGLAHRHLEFINAYASPVSNSGVPVGLACMEQNLKKMQDGLQDKLNGMQNYTDQIRKMQQQFAEESESLKKQMSLLSLELNGGKSNDLNAKGVDYTKFFPGCSGIIPTEALIGTGTGLIGIRDSMNATGMRQSSRDFLDNKNIYEKEIDTIVERMVNDLESNGIDDWIEGGALPSKWTRGGLSSFKGMEETIKEEVAELQIKRKRINEELKKFNYEPPRFDKNFEENYQDFALGARNYFRKNYVSKCALSSSGSGDEKGLGLSVDDIFKRIVNVQNKDGGSTIPNYTAEAREILENDDMLEDKLAAIQNLDQKYGNGMLKVRYINDKRKTTYDTVSDFLKKAINRCQQQYESKNIYSKNQERIQSNAQKAEQAQRAINELGLLFKTFRSKLATSIKDRLKFCSGAVQKEGSCNPKSLSPSNPNFCVAQATQCAERTRACYNRAESLILDRKTKINSVATIYNKRVGELATMQENILNQVKAKVLADSKYLQQFFPGASFVLPPQLAVALPPPMDSPYGVQLRGGGDISFLNNLPFQLEKLQKSMFDQGEKVLKEAQTQVEKENEAMAKNQSKFESLVEECNSNMAAFQKSIQKKMEESIEKQLEDSQKLGEFCNRFDRLKQTNPMAGCDGMNSPRDLYTDAMKITSVLNQEVLPVLGAYENLCALSQGERERGQRRPFDRQAPLLAEECAQSGGDWQEILNQKSMLVLGQFKSAEMKEKVNSFLNGEDASSALGSGPLADKVKMLKTLKSYQGKKTEDFIRELNGPAKDKKLEKLKSVEKELDGLISDVKDYVKGSSSRKVNKDLREIKESLLSDKAKSESSLDDLISKKEELLKEIKSEDAKQSLSEIFDDLAQVRESIKDENLEKLPEVKQDGLGSKHRSKFSGNNETQNLCLQLKDEAVKRSILTCQNDFNFERCFNGEIERNQNEISAGSELYYMNKKLSQISDVQAEDFNISWKRLGELSQTLCTAQMNTDQRLPKGLGESSGELQQLINEIRSQSELR